MNTNTLLKSTVSGMILLSLVSLVSVQNITLPIRVSPGTAAHADETNTNFQGLEDNATTEMTHNVRISNVKINGAATTARVTAGSMITVSLDYTIADPACPACLDEIQLGFSHTKPTGCVYYGKPGSAGTSGSVFFTITAPIAAGTYYLGTDRAHAGSCPTDWWSSAPTTANRQFAVITVR